MIENSVFPVSLKQLLDIKLIWKKDSRNEKGIYRPVRGGRVVSHIYLL